MCFVTSCRCELTTASQTMTISAVLLLFLSLLLPSLHKEHKTVQGWEGMNLGCILSAFVMQLSQWRELADEIHPWTSMWRTKLNFTPTALAQFWHWASWQKSHALLLCCKDIFVLALQERGNDNCLNLQRSKCFLCSLRLELGFLESLFWTTKTKSTGMLN